MLLWLAYGIHKEDVPIILANIAGSTFAFTIVAQKYCYRRCKDPAD